MTEDENKTQPATDQPLDADQGTVRADAATREPDEPRDGEGCEAVTVAVLETCPDNPQLAKLAARTVKENLVGVDALVVIVAHNPEMTILQILERFIRETEVERIVVMTDRMAILNPVTLYDIAIPKALWLGMAKNKLVFDYAGTNTPVMYYRSVLQRLLPYLIQERPHASLPDEYFTRVYPEVRPIQIGRWETDPFVLPVVSANPGREALEMFGAWKKFLFVKTESYPKSLLAYLEERFPEA